MKLKSMHFEYIFIKSFWALIIWKSNGFTVISLPVYLPSMFVKNTALVYMQLHDHNNRKVTELDFLGKFFFSWVLREIYLIFFNEN